MLAQHLLLREHVPQPKFDPQASILQHRGAARHQRLGVDNPPIDEARQHVDILDLFDKGALVDRREQPGPFQIVGDDARQLGPDLRRFLRIAKEIGDRHRHRVQITLRDVDFDRRKGRPSRNNEDDREKLNDPREGGLHGFVRHNLEQSFSYVAPGGMKFTVTSFQPLSPSYL